MINWWIFTLIIAIVLIVVSILLFCKSYSDWIDSLIGGLWVAFVIFCFLSLMFYIDNDNNWEYTDNVNSKTELILSLNDEHSSNINGNIVGGLSFIYGAIRTENNSDYMVMIGDEDNGYILNKFDMEDTYVLFDENEIPYVEYIYIQKSTCDDGIFGRFFKYKPRTKDVIDRVILHMPEDAIEINYSIDFE